MLKAFRAQNISESDVCVVGAGPVGIAFALACEDQGLSVLVVESGNMRASRFSALLINGHRADPAHHAAPEITMCRGLGGTSRWWGGRCVPFDDADFSVRPYVSEATWPISHDEVARWYTAAASFFGTGHPRFVDPDPVCPNLGDVRFDQLERWTPEVSAAVRHRSRLEDSSRIVVVLGATVTKIELSEDSSTVTALTLADVNNSIRIVPKKVVLACGGLETTRLLLATQQHRPTAFGGRGWLGRGYMGHLSGKIADIVLSDPGSAAVHDFYLEGGAFVRRRFTLTPKVMAKERLLNIAFWVDNPRFYQPEHRNGVLSLAWLVLAIAPIGRRLASEAVRVKHVGQSPYRWREHLQNLIWSPIATASDILTILHEHFWSSPRKPGFLVKSQGGRYALHYHAEQAPNRSSLVKLGTTRDVLGLPFLEIDLQFTRRDAASVARAHELLDRSLRDSGLGRLEYRELLLEARIQSIMQQASDGFHQMGTTRMAASPGDGVVDPNCRVHGTDNLYIASSSVFPSSGQATPTFVAVALAFRLAAHLAHLIDRGTAVVQSTKNIRAGV
jgi:choline dehydrogenase-like flavoprotein